MNILRTLKRLAAPTKRISEKQKFVNIRTFLYRELQNKSEQKSWKILVEKQIFGKASCKQKTELHYKYCLVNWFVYILVASK